jgi:hypothetical protein
MQPVAPKGAAVQFEPNGHLYCHLILESLL